MPLDALRRWLGLDEPATADAQTPLRDVLESLDHLEPRRARHLARFAYLLGRVAHADQHVSPEETRAMEALVTEQGGLEPGQAVIVVGLARNAHLMFGSTADFEVAREFAAEAHYEEKLALARCLFAVAATDQAISVAEESEIHRIASILRLQPHDLTQLRVAHASHLPGLAPRRGD
jgi:uncharacterized tellurite resistance protein B-like protein